MSDPAFIPMTPPKEVTTVKARPRPSREELEKIEQPKEKERNETKEETKLEAKPKKRTAKKVKLDNSSIKDKKNKITLIITEKPQAAMKVALALADSSPTARKVGQVIYYELTHKGEEILVGCAVGHIFNLGEVGKKKWPNFDLEWVPNWGKKGSEFTKKYADVLKSLSKNANNFVVACDYDIEGELIGLNVIRSICNQQDAKRMKFSTLTKEDLVKSYETLSEHIDWNLAYAGETRHYLDWIYGINLSRALMNSMKKAGAFKVLSIGRVQGPALALVVKKEKEIQKFKSSIYWQASILTKEYPDLLLKHPNNIIKKQDLEIFTNLKGKKGTIKTEKNQENLPPLTPFDLTTLQLEAHKLLGFSPARTLQIAQTLYLAGVISYPRTSSQKLPSSINYKSVLQKLPKELTKFAVKDKPIEGKKTDPAHPSIYPTGEKAQLESDQTRLYDLIVRRFINCFCDEAIIETKTITAIVEGKKFTAKGISIKQKGWLNVYKFKIDERDLPDLNGDITVAEVKIEEKETQPPHRYTEASLVSELAKRNLGTKATRAAIIETLQKRGYITEKSIKATHLGIAVTETLEKNSPDILDEELTRKFEKGMEAIQASSKGKQKKEEIIDEAKKVLIKISEQLKQNEEKIGKDLLEAQGAVRQEERENSKVILCPKCKKGWVALRRSKFGQFLACDAYPECKTTFSLPPYGLKKKTDKKCESCEWSRFISLQKAKRPWEFCANPECPTRQKSKVNSDQQKKLKY